MQTLKNSIRTFANDESGQNLIEYALIAGLVALVAVGTMTSLGTTVSYAFNRINSVLSSAM